MHGERARAGTREEKIAHKPPVSPDGTLSLRPRYSADATLEAEMGRGLLLWLIGIPLPIILLIWLFGGLG